MSHKTPAKKAEQKKTASKKEPSIKLTPEQEAVLAQKPESGVRAGFTVVRIKAATVITLGCNAIARVETTEEGTPDRRAMIRELDQAFNNMKTCVEQCRAEGDEPVAKLLLSGISLYEDYIAKHERVESLAEDDSVRNVAIEEADRALDALDLRMADLLRSF
ncbi:hypothetical protein TALC_01474 [Thermoplasmatales archaeon BRNA1]|nr:hypothetical protein TALC_01474 [Thermoplasmatales archaeon BRNA1]